MYSNANTECKYSIPGGDVDTGEGRVSISLDDVSMKGRRPTHTCMPRPLALSRASSQLKGSIFSQCVAMTDTSPSVYFPRCPSVSSAITSPTWIPGWCFTYLRP